MSAAPEIAKGWDQAQINAWRENVLSEGRRRDYTVIENHVMALPANTNTVEEYATTSEGYPLYRITVGDVSNGKPNILILGGVHGYEPSGVEASIKFLKEKAPKLSEVFNCNYVVYPCITPWAYEYDQRWNAQAQDPNREFKRGGKSEECQYFMDSVEAHGTKFAAAIDLHETVDRDVELRILRAERFGTIIPLDYKEIPQGFYLMINKDPGKDAAADNMRQTLFGQSIIREVKKISPIAPEPIMLGGKHNYGGLIITPSHEGFTRHYLKDHASLVAVTEVYPDHKDMGPEKAIQAQLAAIRGMTNHVRTLNL